jgi:hypothetical protein
MNTPGFEEIKKAFLDNFEDGVLINQTKTLRAEFTHESEAKWFYENICHPIDLKKEEYPVQFVSSISPIGKEEFTSKTPFSIDFEVNDKDKLIKMLNNK